MKLTDWLTEQKVSDEAFATRIQTSRQAVWRYKSGRIPKPVIMSRITRETDGSVLPVDFYELEAQS